MFLVFAVAFLSISNAQQWLGFTSLEPKASDVNLLQNNSQTVKFEVFIHGVYVTDTIVNGISYKRFYLPGGAFNYTAVAGAPELSVLKYLVATPFCTGTEITYTVNSRQSIAPCKVYPMPKYMADENGIAIENFYIDTNAYEQPRLSNSEMAVLVVSDFMLRSQNGLEIMIAPFEYCPVTQQLEIINSIEVTLNFTNPVGDLRKNLGIFTGLAAGSFINYEDDGTRAINRDRFSEGSVNWFRFDDTTQVVGIQADYLIICADEFFHEDSPHKDIIRLAEHRASYNSYDIFIANVEDIINTEFYYEGQNESPPNETYIKEQRIRTFIRTIYEEGFSNKFDEKLSFLLLVGDCLENNSFMPTSYDHGMPPTEIYEFPSDYYFSCITRDSIGFYDMFAELYMGRFSVNDTTELHNIVEKTLNHETEYSPQIWRKTAGFINGELTNQETDEFYNEYVVSLLDEIGWNYNIVNNWEQPGGLIKDATFNLLNDGAVFVNCNALTNTNNDWDDILRYDFQSLLNNDYKVPFINHYGNNSGFFACESSMPVCLAEFLTRYSPTKGAVGFIGCISGWGTAIIHAPIDTTSLHYKDIYPYYLYNKTSIAGELLLRAKTECIAMPEMFGYHGGLIVGFGKHLFNLFGDPALDILAKGYEITRDITFDCMLEITSSITVRNNATLTIPENCTFTFSNKGSLIISDDGNLVIGDNTIITSDSTGINNSITIAGGGLTVGTGVTFTDLEGGVILKSEQDVYFDYATQYVIADATFNNSNLIHSNTRLNVSNSAFNNSDLTTTSSMSQITGCNFVNSSINSDQTGFLSLNPSHKSRTIVNNSTFVGSIHKTALNINNSTQINITGNEIQGYLKGMSLHNSGTSLSLSPVIDPMFDVIKNNTIFECSTGMELFNVVADLKTNQVYDNIRGIGLYNQSYTAFNNHVTPILTPQIVRDNEAFEFYISQNSFPVLFHYNQIIDEDNKGNQYDDPLFYWDVTNKVKKQDVSNNFWGKNFDPLEDLYPFSFLDWNPVWQAKSGSRTAEDIYNEGLEYFAEEDFVNAEVSFIDLIEEHAQTNFARAAMHELFALRQFTDFNFDALKNYYSTFTESDSTLYETAQFLATRCNIKLKLWQPAIDWYENRIENPPSYPDSVFAVIDLGDIHLMMESDDEMELKSTELIISRFPEIKPKSKEAFESNKSTLLATLPQKKVVKPEPPIAVGNEKGYLGQNIPNPARVSTTVEYAIYIEGNVEIKLFNALGQLVQTISEGTKEAGTYSIEIPLSKIPEGFYHYALYINGERVEAKTMVRY